MNNQIEISGIESISSEIDSILALEAINALFISATSYIRFRKEAGGILGVYNMKSKSILLKQVGSISESKMSAFILNTIEKLSWFNDKQFNFQTKLNKDGSVRCGQVIYSFQGLSENLNTAIALTYAMYDTYMKKYQYSWEQFRGVVLIRQRFEFSNNESIIQVLDGFGEFYESSLVNK